MWNMFEIVIIGVVFLSVVLLIFGVGIMLKSKFEVVMEDWFVVFIGLGKVR